MLKIENITLKEFKKDIYGIYVTLFPKDEQKYYGTIKRLYKKGIATLYKITLDDKTIGFFMIEKLKDYPYYIDYFAIYKEYQNKGYGSKAFRLLIDTIIKEDGLIGEIEEIDENNPITIDRFEFYKRLGFRDFGIKYELFNVVFMPIGIISETDKEKLLSIYYDYFVTSAGKNLLKRNYKIL